ALLSRRHVPELGRAIHAAAGQGLTVRRKFKTGDSVFMAIEHATRSPVLCVPKHDGMIVVPGRKRSAIRRERGTEHITFDRASLEAELARGGIPYLDQMVGRVQRQQLAVRG